MIPRALTYPADLDAIYRLIVDIIVILNFALLNYRNLPKITFIIILKAHFHVHIAGMRSVTSVYNDPGGSSLN